MQLSLLILEYVQEEDDFHNASELICVSNRFFHISFGRKWAFREQYLHIS